MSILSLTEIKNALGIDATNNTWDSLLALISSGVQAQIENEIGTTLDYSTYSDEAVYGNNSPLLYTKHWPITEVVSVYDEYDEEYVKGEDFDYDQYGLFRTDGGLWYKDLKYLITYSAGYNFANGEGSDLKMLALELVSQVWKRFKDKSHGESSRTFPDGSVNYADLNLTDRQKRIIEAHKRILI